MPSMYPLTSLRNFIPTWTALPSDDAGVAGVADGPHTLPAAAVAGDAVVNDHVIGVPVAVPARAPTPPIVAVYVIDGTSGADGVSVTVRLASSYVNVDVTRFPAGS